MDRLPFPAQLMIVSDLDRTMMDPDDPANQAIQRFNDLWELQYRHDSVLVFSTGRSLTLYNQLRAERPSLLTPDVTIMSVGTEIAYGEEMVYDDQWADLLNGEWDRDIVVEETAMFPELTLQDAIEQGTLKVSCNLNNDQANPEEVIGILSQNLENRGLDVKIVYSSSTGVGGTVDVLPRGAGKGSSLRYLLENLGTEGRTPVRTLVCGDSGNDIELFEVPGVYGVIVSNAREELLNWCAGHAEDNPNIFLATQRCADGIIEAIQHFGL